MDEAQSWYNDLVRRNAERAILAISQERMAGSPGSPVVRTPAPSSGPGRKTFRGPGRPSPAARPPAPLAEEPFELDAQPPDWVVDVTSPTEVTARVDVDPESNAAQDEALVARIANELFIQSRRSSERYIESLRSTHPAAPHTVSSLNVRTDEVQPIQLFPRFPDPAVTQVI